MSSINMASKTFLEAVLGMTDGYVLDFSNASFANFFRELNIDIYDAERYPGFGDSKANRMRALWKSGSDGDVASSLRALAEYIEAKKAAGSLGAEFSDEQVDRIRTIAQSTAGSASEDDEALVESSVPASFTTEATVTANKIQIEIHEDIYNHIDQYLETGHYFHAVEESYKVVREMLREKTGSEKATDAFMRPNQQKIFGHAPTSPAEKDFFDGVKYLNMSIQFLRNEKSHTLATPLEPNLALHYISLASLAYDLITRYVSDEIIMQIEESITSKRRSYSAGAFYRAFEGGRWMKGLSLPAEFESTSVRRVLKKKWLEEVDFTRSWDHSNIMLMRLELVAEELSKADLDELLDLPTIDDHGHDQEAGMLPFLIFMCQKYPDKISSKVDGWIADQTREYAEI